MNNFIKGMKICKGQFLEWPITPRVYLSFALGILFTVLPSVWYLQYSLELLQPINIFEPFIIIINNRFFNAFLFLGYLFLVADAPFMTHRGFYSVIRTTKSAWGLGILLYIFTSALVYYLIMFIVSVVVGASHGFFANIWSDPIYRLCANTPAFAIKKYYLSFSNIAYLQNFTPISSTIQCILMSSFYGAIIGSIIFVINLNIRKIYGGLVGLLIHLLGFVILTSGYMLAPQRLSLLAHVIPVMHNIDGQSNMFPTFEESYWLLGIGLLLLSILSIFMAKRCDFKTSIGDKF